MPQLPTIFSPKEVESKWYQKWESAKAFRPNEKALKGPYCIIMPPPNVTGRLHIGHALDVVTQDVPIRYKRMSGHKALWIPGTDHAGIATEVKVEELIWEREKKRKTDYKREDFVEKVWQWKREHGDIIHRQQRALGASCDWDYSLFTMDPISIKAVKKAFKTWYDNKLIYQDDYIVNWDPVLQSAISDAEVEHIDVQGAFYHIHYRVKGSGQFLEVATTRPETMYGDTAVAVHPEDERYKDLIGKTAIIPLCEREVPIIGDSYVDIEKGTGCLKVTPGHDFNDFAIGKRHQLETLSILNKDGTLNAYANEFKGMSCQKARPKVVNKLNDSGLLVATHPHTHPVGHGERSKAVIEPLISKQWFVDTKKMSEIAVDAVEQGHMRFIPKGWENTYFSWLKNPKDWCISRQLWWGHRIPVFTCQTCQNQWASEEENPSCSKCKKSKIEQDPDVLDTWFSSGLWPLSTLGWPDEKLMQQKDFATFFPTSTLVTGHDIIFFWVARMMMMSLYFKKEVPFKDVYIHALVRDKFGRKMSKSLGNGIGPLEMIEQFGADALRFSLASGAGYGRSINLDPKRIEGQRNFINKIWNAFRFIHPFIQSDEAQLKDFSTLSHHEKWILSEFNRVATQMGQSMDEYRFDDACSSLYAFVYDKFCGYFIELSKSILYKGDESEKSQRSAVLKLVFRQILKLMHPFCPFITEEIWDHLKGQDESLLIHQDYPTQNDKWDFPDDREKMNDFIDATSKIRRMRSNVNLKPSDEIEVFFYSDDKQYLDYLLANQSTLGDLARVKKIHRAPKQKDPPPNALLSTQGHSDIYVLLEGLIDVEKHHLKMKKELKKLKIEHQKYVAKLQNKKFLDKAPEQVVLEVKNKEKLAKEKIESLSNRLKSFGST